MGSPITCGGAGSGINYSFVAMGPDNIAQAMSLVGSINGALGGGTPVTTLSPESGSALRPGQSSAVPIYNLQNGGALGSPQVFTPSVSGYIVDTLSGALTINGGADSVLVAGADAATTFNETAGSNDVVFVDGNNVFTGSSSVTGGIDTITAGSGLDTINTGASNSTVYAGTGDATITLSDTGSLQFNDRAYLDSGHAVVYAEGTGDGVIAGASGQSVVGGTGQLAVVLQSASSENTVTAGSGTTAVFISSDDNTINAGSGVTYIVPGAGVSDVVNAGSGSAFVFGLDGDNITMATTAGDTGLSYFIAGTGNETLSGAAATNQMFIYGGSGTESLTAGTGNDQYILNAGTTTDGNITITDFSASNSHLNLIGFTSADVTALTSGGADVGGNYVVSLSNGLTLTFDGVTTGSELGHIKSF